MPDLVLFSSRKPHASHPLICFLNDAASSRKAGGDAGRREGEVRRDVDTAENDEPTVMRRERLHLVTSMLSTRSGALCA